MIAVDTNVIVRLIMGDSAEELVLAEQVVAEGVIIPHTVLMETEWVLRSAYRLDRSAIGTAIDKLLSLPTVSVERAQDVRWALDRFAAGADLADMLHIVAISAASAFATFDRRLATAARPAPIPIRILA